MALATEVQTWLDDLKKTGAISDEELKVLTSVAEKPQAGEFIKGSQLRQADFSRKLNEIDQIKNQLAQKEAQVTKFQTDVAQWKAGAEKNFLKAVAEREALEKQYSSAAAKLKSIATQYGIDEAEIKLEEPVVIPKTDPVLENKNYLTRDEAAEYIKKVATEAAFTDASIHDLSNRHFALFGKPLPNAIGLLQEALAAGKPLSAYFEEKFNTKAREAELLEEQIQKRIDAKVAERELQLRSEQHLEAPARPGDGSILFDKKFNPKTDGVQHDSVGAAIAAYQSGKYRPNMGDKS